LGHVGTFAYRLIDRQRAVLCVVIATLEAPSASLIFGSTPKKMNCASAQIELAKISEASICLRKK
jgi:hypothetical protein